jgi:hypothetical protein
MTLEKLRTRLIAKEFDVIFVEEELATLATEDGGCGRLRIVFVCSRVAA